MRYEATLSGFLLSRNCQTRDITNIFSRLSFFLDAQRFASPPFDIDRSFVAQRRMRAYRSQTSQSIHRRSEARETRQTTDGFSELCNGTAPLLLYPIPKKILLLYIRSFCILYSIKKKYNIYRYIYYKGLRGRTETEHRRGTDKQIALKTAQNKTIIGIKRGNAAGL